MARNILRYTCYSAVAFILCLFVISVKESSGFVCVHRRARSLQTPSMTSHVLVGLFMSDPQKEPDNGGLLSRFTDPVIDDPGLPLADTLVAQIVAPSLQVFWLSLVHAPSPTWLRPIFDNSLWQARGSLVAPTLIHGAGLAFCWLAGALAAQAYQRNAYDPTVDGYGTVLFRIAQAGAFATGLLILGTQIDLFAEFGRYVQPGESEEIDLRLLSAVVELINDIIFEASCITSSRLFLAFMTARGEANRNNDS
jgi:hypothetical protein